MTLRKSAAFGLIVIAILATLATSLEKHYDGEVIKARNFCEALIPPLEHARERSGRYPERLEPSWYPQPTPSLLRIDDFYLVVEDGSRFLLRFRDPRMDPRFWFDDVYAYDSREKGWLRYDGY